MIRLRSGIQVIGLALSRRGLQTRINMSGPVETSIRSKINSKLTPEHLDVINESYMHNVPKGSESHFKVVVVSSQFENKPLIQRHRMVNEALSEEFNSGLHALSIEAKTPSQWADSNKKLFHSGEIVDLTNEDETDLPLAGGDTVKSVLAVKKVERLFGRGALAQGFYSPAKKLPPSNTIPLEGNNPRPARSMESFPEATQGNSAHLVTTTEPGNSQLFHSDEVICLSEEEESGSHAGDDTMKNADTFKKVESLFNRGVLTQDFFSPTKKSLSFSSVSHGKSYSKVVHTMESAEADSYLSLSSELGKLQIVKTNEKAVKNVCENNNNNNNCVESVIKADIDEKSEDFVDTCIKKKATEPQILQLVLNKGDVASNRVKEKNDEGTVKEASQQQVKGGIYYLKILDERVKILEDIADKCEADIQLCKIEESKGELRSIAGNARLLVKEKFNQFRGLCHKNISGSVCDTFPTTNKDLQGFWDMILIQFDDIVTKYETINIMKANGWKMPQTKIAKVKPSTSSQRTKFTPLRTIQPVKSSKSLTKTNPPKKIQSEILKAREAERKKMLQERRLAMKKLSSEPSINLNKVL